MKSHIHRLTALLLLAVCTLFMSACNAFASAAGPPDPDGKKKPVLTFDLTDGVCAQTPDGNYRACFNPLTKAYTVKASAPWARGYALTYDSATKSYRGTMPDGTTAVYKPGSGLTVEPPLPQSGKDPQRTALITFEWERWLCAHSPPPAGGTA